MIPAESVISVLAVTLIGAAGLLSMLPVGTCVQCNHCRLEQLERERKHELQRQAAGEYPFCPVCGNRHRPDESHQQR